MRCKKVLIGLVIVMQLFSSCLAQAAEAKKATTIGATARSYVLMEEESGKILLEKEKDTPFPPASITKIMTLLLIQDAIAAGKITWEDKVSVSEHAAHMGGSQVYMEPGEEQTVRDLVKCICIASANDAAVAMAEYIAGSEEQFVEMMNERAKGLGMHHTVFKNACGLHTEGHVSTAEDIALMSRELMQKYPELSKTLTIWMDSIVHHTRRGDSEFGLSNTNKMIKWYKGITGLKTGYTPEAKHCVSATATRDDMHLIAVVMGAQDGKIRFQEAAQLLDYGFANYKVKTGPKMGTVVGKVEVKKGDKEFLEVTPEETKALVVPKQNDKEELTYTLEYKKGLCAPIAKGEQVGTIIYSLGGNEVGREPVVATYDVAKAKLSDMLPYMLKRYFNLSH
ncbi:D-alanyl-D-alanine carboxypeptidase [Sporanaerobium hydrogeniformans]|uniref:D-alanyl-D-alanine carboxypeptidase n=1 Tax=Sporanaerobium hydrogeniformans TaxID=3072179 RepID=A0AC61DE99_9FIRM|nr:D-alanyl-D-alanine carboxypeptidase family protein [Sporanaerobium hydrogeniformans]PHV71153.1 D-alanyl-D-alanine carboxypeptidase [Sporanaerobium hydrogeniformans]